MGKVSKDKRDIYYRLAKQNGYRSRSAFKLLQIDDTFNIFENVKCVVDFCAAPGGWSQIAAERLKGKEGKIIIAVDLQEIAPIEGVEVLLGDITNQNTLMQIMKLANGNMIDLVLCDGAPDITGFNEFDVYVQFQLILSALNTSIRMLKEGGTFISKLFKGKHTDKVIQILLKFFRTVTIAKPRSCRNATFESFIVCQDFYIGDDERLRLRESALDQKDIITLNNIYDNRLQFDYEKFGVKLIQVGKDEYDSDKTYTLESTNYTSILQPVQCPINPPYKFYLDNQKGKINYK